MQRKRIDGNLDFLIGLPVEKALEIFSNAEIRRVASTKDNYDTELVVKVIKIDDKIIIYSDKFLLKV